MVPQTKPGLPRQAVEKVYRLAGIKVAVALARIALNNPPATVQTFEPVSPADQTREGLPRVAYIGQIFSRQRKPEVDEPILYGANTDGMLPIMLHPDEWLDGAIVPSLHSWFGGTETYFYQNNPIVLDLYERHHAREINFVGTVATIAGSDNFDRERHCRAAANLVKWNLQADGAVLSKYGGGLPHADLSETARLLEGMGIRTAVMVSTCRAIGASNRRCCLMSRKSTRSSTTAATAPIGKFRIWIESSPQRISFVNCSTAP